MLQPYSFYKTRKAVRLLLRDLVKWSLLAPAGFGVKGIPNFSVQNERKHLVVFRPDGIGDFIIFARDLHRLRAIYPTHEWTITLVGNHVWRALAEEWNSHLSGSWFDHFVSVDRKRLRYEGAYRKELAVAMKGLVCDELIYPAQSRDIWGNILSNWVDTPSKITPEGDTASIVKPFKLLYDRCFTQLVAESGKKDLEHERNDYFLCSLGDKTSTNRKFIPLPVTSTMMTERLSSFGRIKLDPNAHYAVIFPGAAWAGKHWPKENFVEWGKHYIEKTGNYVVVCGNFAESELGEDIAHHIGPKAINIAGHTSLIGLAGVLAMANVCLSNDTAAVHISAAFNRSTICIMGGGHWGRFWPYGDMSKNQTWNYEMPCYGCGWECRYVGNPVPCVKLIKVASCLSDTLPIK